MDRVTRDAGVYTAVNRMDKDITRNDTNEKHFGADELRDTSSNDEADNMHEGHKTRDDDVITSDMTPFEQFREHINNLWLWEIFSVICSIVFMVIVIWRLVTINDKPLSTWPAYWPKPNTFIAIFVTASKSFMLFALTAGMAQLRWLHFRSRPRSLEELDAFEGASRGPAGSLKFLITGKFKAGKAATFAAWGAVLMLLALAMDPFAQEIVGYPLLEVPLPTSGNPAWQPVSRGVAAAAGNFLNSTPDRQKFIFSGLLQIDAPTPYGCTSGNCTWDPFTSFGITSNCMDASSVVPNCVNGSGVVNVNCTQLEYTFTAPDMTLVLQNSSSVIADQGNGLVPSRAFSLIKSVVSDAIPLGSRDPMIFGFAFASFNVLLSDDDPTVDNSENLAHPTWNITTCSLSFCAKVYDDLKVVNATLINDDPRDVQLKALDNSTCWSGNECSEFTPVNPSDIPQGSISTFKNIIGLTPVNIRNILVFDYNITTAANSTTLVPGVGWTYTLAQTLFWNKDIPAIFRSLSTDYTNYIRWSSDSVNVTGVATANETYVHVSWGWFVLPAAMVLASAAFLATIIIYTRWAFDGKNVTWKASTLPLLLHGLDGWDRQGYGQTETIGAMESKAKEMQAMLRRNDGGEIRFVKS